MSKKFGGFNVAGKEQKEEKNWGMQILVLSALGLLFVVPWVVVAIWGPFKHGCNATGKAGCSTHASVALVAAIVVLDVLLLILLARRAVRTWRW